MFTLFFRPHETQLYQPIRNTQWPIIYCMEYNIGFMGLEKLHPFDAGKWGRVYEFLKGLVQNSLVKLLLLFIVTLLYTWDVGQ